ncbi:hypothetical protein IC355_005119, partial [Shigella flexneri]|nr:hypothetical protein [Shigella flexneri]EIQ7486352.1 hypothetical protein [Escherichia coli]EGF7275830.1 hypothetical protein [Shigella flexneri]EJD1574509.1 hypothetical protein [Shigella flexneri]EJK4476944.1 hypothetical protein [Shigella flexneri]
MASERSTDVQAFIGELDGGVFETKIGAVLGNDSNLLIVFYVQIMPDD